MSAPVYEIGETETTNQALERLGFYRRWPGVIIRKNDGKRVAATRTVFDTNDWIRKGCPDLDGGDHTEPVDEAHPRYSDADAAEQTQVVS